MDFALPPYSSTSNLTDVLKPVIKVATPLVTRLTETPEGFFKQPATVIEKPPTTVQSFFEPLLEAITNIATPPTKPKTQPTTPPPKKPNTRPKPTK